VTMVAADLGGVLVACAIGVGIAAVVGLLLTYGLRWLSRRINFDLRLQASWRSPVVLLAVVIALDWVLYRSEDQQQWAATVTNVLDMVIIGIVGWIVLLIVRAIESTALIRIRNQDADSRGSRHLQTKITLVQRVVSAMVITITVGAALWTIPAMKQLGAAILASAGVIGIVAGLAAQSTLGNLFAGLQIAFTDAIRIDDIVDIGDQWGRIDEITLSYVVVKVWDGTSLILPCTYFTTTGFRNRTHAQLATSGTIEIAVTWQVPIEALRDELARVLAQSPDWDGDVGTISVTDASSPVLQVVAVVSASSNDQLAKLRTEVREALIEFIRRDHPEAVPAALPAPSPPAS
jgi:small-conductance mechanosensitive channel